MTGPDKERDYSGDDNPHGQSAPTVAKRDKALCRFNWACKSKKCKYHHPFGWLADGKEHKIVKVNCSGCAKPQHVIEMLTLELEKKFADKWKQYYRCKVCGTVENLNGTEQAFKRRASTPPPKPVTESDQELKDRVAKIVGLVTQQAGETKPAEKKHENKQVKAQTAVQSEADGITHLVEEKLRAQSIQSSSPYTSVAPAISVGKLKIRTGEGMANSTAFAVDDGKSGKVVAIWHGIVDGLDVPTFYYEHKFKQPVELRNKKSDAANEAIRVEGYDLAFYPKPISVKGMKLAVPKEGESITIWSALMNESEVKQSHGHVMNTGRSIKYTDEKMRVYECKTCAVGTYSSTSSASGSPVTNAKGECVGIHCASSDKPNSPGYFIPMTPELISILMTPMPSLN
jgi:hypothetical protein